MIDIDIRSRSLVVAFPLLLVGCFSGVDEEPSASSEGTDTQSDDVDESSESGTETRGSTDSDESDTTETETETETDTTEPECGNAVTETGEACDDGNLDESDDCTSLCQLPSCADGFRNGDESDVDCGGGCPECELGSSCLMGDDCVTLACIDGQCSHAETCRDLLTRTPDLPSSSYVIDIDGAMGSTPPFEVGCEMEFDGGGWTLIQRTVWDPAKTLPLLTNYDGWYALMLGSLDIQDAYRMAGRYWQHFNVEKDHLLVHYLLQASNYESCDPLYYKGADGVLTVTDSVAFLNGLQSNVPMISNNQLSTTDSGPWSECSTDHDAVAWFYGYCCSTCPTFASDYWDSRHPMVGYSTTPDFFEHTKADVCEGDAVPTLLGPGNPMRGVDRMEYYIR